MDKISGWIHRHMPSQRRLIQLYAALLYNANLKGYISGEIYTGGTKVLCLPGLNCYSCPAAVGACPLGALQNALASSGHRAPFYVAGILMLFGLTLGRTICGFLCPMGLLQELLYKIPTPKLPKGRVTRALSWLKYVLLIVLVAAVPLWYAAKGYPVPAFCKYICPAGTLEGAVALLANPANAPLFSMLDILFTRKFVIMVIIFTICIFTYRGFCRFLCPLGAIYGCFSGIHPVGTAVEEAKCIHCGLCVRGCKMDIRRVGDHECISCAECADICPTKAISFRVGKFVLYTGGEAAAVLRPDAAGGPGAAERLRPAKVPDAAGREEAAERLRPAKTSDTIGRKEAAGRMKRYRLAAWTAALAVLAGVLWYYNAPRATAEAELPVGSEAGMLGPDFTVPLYGDGGSFALADTRGRVTVINFWATWCAPCVAELPYFDRLYQNYGDEVAVIALHSELVTDDVEEYLAGFDYEMPFALDDGGVMAAYGGSSMLPQTIVLDQNGVVVYNQVGSVTYEVLESLVLPLLE